MSKTQQAELERWLFDDSPTLTYEQAGERLEREFGVRLSKGALTGFYQKRIKARMLAQAMASGGADEPGRDRTAAYQALMHLVGLLGFDLAVSGEKMSLRELQRLQRLAATGLAAEHAMKRLRLREREIAVLAKMAELRERLVVLKEQASRARAAKASNKKRAEEKGTIPFPENLCPAMAA